MGIKSMHILLGLLLTVYKNYVKLLKFKKVEAKTMKTVSNKLDKNYCSFIFKLSI